MIVILSIQNTLKQASIYNAKNTNTIVELAIASSLHNNSTCGVKK